MPTRNSLSLISLGTPTSIKCLLEPERPIMAPSRRVVKAWMAFGGGTLLSRSDARRGGKRVAANLGREIPSPRVREEGAVIAQSTERGVRASARELELSFDRSQFGHRRH